MWILDLYVATKQLFKSSVVNLTSCINPFVLTVCDGSPETSVFVFFRSNTHHHHKPNKKRSVRTKRTSTHYIEESTATKALQHQEKKPGKSRQLEGWRPLKIVMCIKYSDVNSTIKTKKMVKKYSLPIKQPTIRSK